jgi:hypothetical protein
MHREQSLEPRILRYRHHYKYYLAAYLILAAGVAAYWGYQFALHPLSEILQHHWYELTGSVLFFAVSALGYVFYYRLRLDRSVQVFPDHILLHHRTRIEIHYRDIESIKVVCWSLFFVRMQNGDKHYFNSALERMDYVWQGLFEARPDLIPASDYEEFRIRLLQYDHHQKRKEWFLRHRMLDAFMWVGLPVILLAASYAVQSQEVVIHQKGMYFFRLFMFSWVVLLFTSFCWSMVLKKFVFDRLLQQKRAAGGEQVRDLEFEGIVLHRSKLYQMCTSGFLFSLLVYFNVNLISVARIRDEMAQFNLKRGKTLMVDNRYNCIKCRYQIKDGDLVVFGRGHIGQVMAQEGDFVGEVVQDKAGRMIASENILEVPSGSIAVKAANGKDIIFVPVHELTGKVRH